MPNIRWFGGLLCNIPFSHFTLNSRNSFPLMWHIGAHLCLHTLVNTLLHVKQWVTSCCIDRASVIEHAKAYYTLFVFSWIIAGFPVCLPHQPQPPPLQLFLTVHPPKVTQRPLNTPTFTSMYVRQLLACALPTLNSNRQYFIWQTSWSSLFHTT